MKAFPLALAALLLTLFAPAEAGAQYLTGQMTPGRYEVGFKVVHEYDYGRTYAPNYELSGAPIRTPSPRPMQMGIWYPAEKDGQSYMQYRDYTYLDATVEDFHADLSETARLNLDQTFQLQPVFTGTANPDILHRTLDMRTRAIRDAHAVDGKFPLVIYSPREYRGIYYNTQLIEYIVSHGYVVVATPNKDEVDAVNQSQVTPEMLMTNLDDLRFAKAFASRLENVNPERVGVVGWAWGAMSAMGLALTDPNISGFVSLDGNMRFQGQRATLQPLAFHRAANLSTPMLHLETSNVQQPAPVDYTFFDQIKYADAYHIKLREATFFAMSSFFNLVHGKGVDNPTQFDYEAIDLTYDFVMAKTLAFLDVYVRGNDDRRADLMAEPIGRFSALTTESKHTEGITPPPTQAFFTRQFNSDFETAVAMWYDVKERDPGYVIATAPVLNAIGYGQIGQGETEAAIAAFKMQAETFPWLANAWDSLGEGYMANGDDDMAIEAFLKTLTMNPPQNVKANSLSLLGQLGHDYQTPSAVELNAEEVAGFLGTYELPAGGQTVLVTVEWDDNALIAKTAGQPTIQLHAQASGVFWAAAAGQMLGRTVEFRRDGGATAMYVTPAGSNQQLVAPRSASE